jgi:hypothetical protein
MRKTQFIVGARLAREERFAVIGETGEFPDVHLEPKGEECPYFKIYPALMPEAQD